MENNYEQFLKEYPQRLTKKIENSNAFQQALVFASEKEKREGDLPIKGFKISSVEILISFSMQDKTPNTINFSVRIPEENHNF